MRSIRSSLFAVCLATALLARPVAAQPPPPTDSAGELSDDSKLERIVTLFESGKYAECTTEFKKLLIPEPDLEDPDVLERARTYYAACLMAVGKNDEADQQFKTAIRENPQMQPPDRLVYPAPVVERFIRVRDSMLDEIKKAEEDRIKKARAAAKAAAERRERERLRVEALEKLAAQEVVITKNRRWIAAVPFGVGQFQNDDTALGYLFLGTEVALGGTALGAMLVRLSLDARADDQPPPNNEELNANNTTANNVLKFSSWGFVSVAALGILEAQLSFEPEVRHVVQRPLPKDLQRPKPEKSDVSLRPSALPTPGGLQLGVIGRF
ncbi:MAG: hypothetical protein KC776_19945 [Myxococcales bacterium]|nr:hypothetical protein [Myxococcales bacterium]MCB9576868.1 hypothetical protein [Polyangiaceae bacterium]